MKKSGVHSCVSTRESLTQKCMTKEAMKYHSHRQRPQNLLPENVFPPQRETQPDFCFIITKRSSFLQAFQICFSSRKDNTKRCSCKCSSFVLNLFLCMIMISQNALDLLLMLSLQDMNSLTRETDSHSQETWKRCVKSRMFFVRKHWNTRKNLRDCHQTSFHLIFHLRVGFGISCCSILRCCLFHFNANHHFVKIANDVTTLHQSYLSKASVNTKIQSKS